MQVVTMPFPSDTLWDIAPPSLQGLCESLGGTWFQTNNHSIDLEMTLTINRDVSFYTEPTRPANNFPPVLRRRVKVPKKRAERLDLQQKQHPVHVPRILLPINQTTKRRQQNFREPLQAFLIPSRHGPEIHAGIPELLLGGTLLQHP